MAALWLPFGVLFFVAVTEINSQGPPKVTGSYKATGEMVETLEDESGILIQVAFEESYDAETQNSAFNVWVMGKNVTYVENFKTNQTFRYMDGKECQQMTIEEWIKTKSPPTLLPYEDSKGIVRFSMKQLFSLDDKYLIEKNLSDVFRGVPARKWMYSITGNEPDTDEKRIISIYAYWSDDTWNTTSNEESVPLGFIVSKKKYHKNEVDIQLHEQFINVYGFVPGAINHKLFEPVQGVICKNKVQTLKFPDVSNIQALALHSEIIFPDYQQIKYVDTWFDPRNKLLRMDSERIKEDVPIFDSKSRKFQSEMVLGRMGVVFRRGFFEGKSACTVVPIKDFDFDIQNLINIKADVKDWTISKAFGLNQTSYTYIGKTSKRDIPCHLFQGVRTDWPEPSSGVESLWEWCFSVNLTTKDDAVIFRNGEYGLVNAQVSILKNDSSWDFPPKFRIFHHFYDVTLRDPDVMDSTNFDIGNCFEEGEKRRLQFVVNWDVTDDSIYLIENATSDINFLKGWKSAIYQFSGLIPYTLRVSNVHSMVIKKKLYVKFTILGPHKDLPVEIKNNQKESFDAENTLRKKILDRAVVMYYTPSNNKSMVLKLGVIPHSLQLQLNRTFKPHELPTTTPNPKPGTTTFRIPFSLLTEPDEDTSTSSVSVTGSQQTSTKGTMSTGSKTSKDPKESTPTPTTGHLKNNPKILHKGGTVAAVSIAMLLVGISIGSTGIFIKYNGLPACLKCGGSSSV